jgi:hypothetical protein
MLHCISREVIKMAIFLSMLMRLSYIAECESLRPPYECTRMKVNASTVYNERRCLIHILVSIRELHRQQNAWHILSRVD